MKSLSVPKRVSQGHSVPCCWTLPGFILCCTAEHSANTFSSASRFQLKLVHPYKMMHIIQSLQAAVVLLHAKESDRLARMDPQVLSKLRRPLIQAWALGPCIRSIFNSASSTDRRVQTQTRTHACTCALEAAKELPEMQWALPISAALLDLTCTAVRAQPSDEAPGEVAPSCRRVESM